MTEIEETLSRILTAEADHHEPPVFNAYRIADAATARRRRWRPTLFALAVAVLGVGGVGGATVFANGGGHTQLRPQPQPIPRPSFLGQAVVTFHSRPGTVSTQAADDEVLSWLHKKTEADGLTDVGTTIWHDPWRLEVIGPVAGLDRFEKLDLPGILQFRPVVAGGGRRPRISPSTTPRSSTPNNSPRPGTPRPAPSGPSSSPSTTRATGPSPTSPLRTPTSRSRFWSTAYPPA